MAGVYQPTPPAALHNAVSTTEITADKWTALAVRTGRYWRWSDTYSSTEAQQALRARCDADDIIVMHRRIAGGWELVARLSGPAWRRFQARRA